MTIDKERLRVLIKELRTDARVDSLFGGAATNKLSERAADVLTEFEAENAALAAEVERLRIDVRRVDAFIKFIRDNAFNLELHTHETRDLLETCKRLEEWRSGIND